MDENRIILKDGSSVFPMEGGWIFKIPWGSRVFLKFSFKKCRLKKQNNKNKVTLTGYYTCQINNREGVWVKRKKKDLPLKAQMGHFPRRPTDPGRLRAHHMALDLPSFPGPRRSKRQEKGKVVQNSSLEQCFADSLGNVINTVSARSVFYQLVSSVIDCRDSFASIKCKP